MILTITFSRDGRNWYGARRYKMRIEGATGHLAVGRMTVEDSKTMMIRIIEKEIAEGRDFQIVDNT